MFKVVVVDLSYDGPGKCYAGFTSREHAVNWAVEHGLWFSDGHKVIIFDPAQEQDINVNPIPTGNCSFGPEAWR